jgi:hypothetical protein
MKGKVEFYSFQPSFWAILKSFNFGRNFFNWLNALLS